MTNKMKFLGAALLAVFLTASVVKADTVIAPQAASKAGINLSPTNTGLVASAGYQFRNNGKTFLLFVKTGAGSSTVSVTVQASLGGISIPAQTITVPATTGNVIAGPFPPAMFSDANGDVHFTMSDTVGLSLSAIQL